MPTVYRISRHIDTIAAAVWGRPGSFWEARKHHTPQDRPHCLNVGMGPFRKRSSRRLLHLLGTKPAGRYTRCFCGFLIQIQYGNHRGRVDRRGRHYLTYRTLPITAVVQCRRRDPPPSQTLRTEVFPMVRQQPKTPAQNVVSDADPFQSFKNKATDRLRVNELSVARLVFTMRQRPYPLVSPLGHPIRVMIREPSWHRSRETPAGRPAVKA